MTGDHDYCEWGIEKFIKIYLVRSAVTYVFKNLGYKVMKTIIEINLGKKIWLKLIY